MKPTLILFPALLLLVGCKTREIPRPEPNWMPIGGTHGTVTLLDTVRVGVEGDARLVWLRLDSLKYDAEQKPSLVPGARLETLHRVRCGPQTVDDLRLSPQGSSRVPGPTDLLVLEANRPFARHPYGERVFPTVCAALGRLTRLKPKDA
jgi:hypothetical protein